MTQARHFEECFDVQLLLLASQLSYELHDTQSIESLFEAGFTASGR